MDEWISQNRLSFLDELSSAKSTGTKEYPSDQPRLKAKNLLQMYELHGHEHAKEAPHIYSDYVNKQSHQ
nr:hypothetical protein [Alkalihalobacillus deserti]